MSTKSLYFLPAWQRAKRGLNHPMVMGSIYCPRRCGHNAVCVNEDLIVWGGYSYESAISEYAGTTYCERDALWVYNMDNDFWFSVETNGISPIKRSGACSVLIWPHWYIIGGYTLLGDTNEVHSINLLTLTWELISTSVPAMCGRDKATAWAWENRIYCHGGYGPNPSKHYLWDDYSDRFILEELNHRGWNDQLIYLDLVTREWVRPHCSGTKPVARAAHSSTLVNSRVYIFGGRHQGQRMNDLHCFSLDNDTWSGSIMCLGEVPCGRSWHTMTRSDNAHLLLFGGFSQGNIPLDDSWLLNIDTLSWSFISHHPQLPRLWHTASLNCVGDILIFGGCTTNIIDPEVPTDTSNQAILFRTKPFELQRLCLHTLFNHRDRTEQMWEHLPRSLNQWLRNRKMFHSEFRPHFYEPTVELGHAPSLSSLSVISQEEASNLNEELRRLDPLSQQGYDPVAYFF